MTSLADSQAGRSGWFSFVELAWFVTVVASALAMGAALAHAFELPNKIGMNEADYYAAQQSYRGWNQLAILLSIQATGILAFAISMRRVRPILWRMCVAGAAFLASQAIFWLFTFPANLATDSWTLMPPHWEALRAQWEYSHLAGAAFQVIAFSFVLLALQRRISLRREAALA